MLSHKIQISISCTITRTVLYLFSLHTSQKVCLELLFDFAIADRDLRIWGTLKWNNEENGTAKFAVQLNTMKVHYKALEQKHKGGCQLGYCTDLHLFDSCLEPHTVTLSLNLYVLWHAGHTTNTWKLSLHPSVFLIAYTFCGQTPAISKATFEKPPMIQKKLIKKFNKCWCSFIRKIVRSL